MKFSDMLWLLPALDQASQSTLLAACGVVLDNTSLCRFIDRLVGTRERRLRFVGGALSNKLLHLLYFVAHGALTTEIKDALFERLLVCLFCVCSNSHSAEIVAHISHFAT